MGTPKIDGNNNNLVQEVFGQMIGAAKTFHKTVADSFKALSGPDNYKSSFANWDTWATRAKKNGRLHGESIRLLSPRVQTLLKDKPSFVEKIKHKLLQAKPLAAPKKIKDIHCAKSTYVFFHANVTLRECTLARDTMIQGTHFSKGSKVKFDQNGKVTP